MPKFRWWPWGKDKPVVPTEEDLRMAGVYFDAITTPAGRQLYQDLMSKFYDTPCEGQIEEGMRRVMLHVSDFARLGYRHRRQNDVLTEAQVEELDRKAAAIPGIGDAAAQLITGSQEDLDNA